MFWIFKFTPDFLWYVLPALGLVMLTLSRVPLLYLYKTMLNIAGTVILVIGVFMLGMLYANNQWQQVVKELQVKVVVAEAESKTVNAQVETKVVTRTQVVKQRGETVVHYIDREVVKIDERCVIPPEFVSAHNQAASK